MNGSTQPFLQRLASAEGMRVGFREKPSDLFLVAALSAVLSAVAAIGLGGVAGFVAGFVLVLVLPGYAIMAALFPAAGEITWLQRLTLSVGLGIAAVSLVGLLSNFAPWGIHVGAIIVILDLGTVGLCAVAYVRRQALPPERRLGFAVNVDTPRWSRFSATERTLVVVLGLALGTAGTWIAYSASRVGPVPGFTELALLNESGQPGGYPTNLVIGEVATVIVLVINRESMSVNYTLDAWIATLGQVYNASSGQNETVEVASTLTSSYYVVLTDGTSLRIPHTFHIDQAGDYRLKFYLYRGPPAPDPYRALRLNITVS